jgi:hypothetical protein
MTKTPHPKPLEEVSIKLDADATPSRVLQMVQTFAATVVELGGETPGLTLVVSNRDLMVSLRAYDEQALSPVQTLVGIVADPIDMMQREPSTRAAAAAFSKGLATVAHLRGTVFVRSAATGGRARKLRQFDEVLVNAIQAASRVQEVPGTFIAGTTEIYSPVLRVGRAAEKAGHFARLFIDGDYRDAAIEPSAVPDFFDAAKAGGMHRVQIEAQWWKSGDLPMKIEVKSVVALSAHRHRSVSGMEFVRLMSGLDSSGLDEALEHLREQRALS